MRDDDAFEQLMAAVTLSRLPGVGARAFKDLVNEHGSPQQALDVRSSEAAWLDSSATKSPLDRAQLDTLARLPRSVQFTYFGAPDYPSQLEGVPEPPPYLFRTGPLWPLPSPTVAIVGARQCTQHGEAFAQELASQLARQGVTVVSGGALGIDAAAHSGALAVKGATTLVKASGIDLFYPKKNLELHQEIERTGCALTELLPGSPPRRNFFPTRNRILVGLCCATIVVEGALRSGTSTSAFHALKLNRPIFTWPHSPEGSLRELPDHLIKDGAIPLAEPTAEAVLAAV